MATRSDTDRHKAARTAVLAVQSALETHHQHPDEPGLWRPALRRAATAVTAVTAATPLVMFLQAGQLRVGHEAVLPFQPDAAPFGLLRAQGIGEIVVAADTATEVAERLILQLAGLAHGTAGESDLAALFASDDLPGIELRAAADLGTSSGDELAMWAALPAPQPGSPALRALVERDATSNLPAFAARQLLDDCEHLGGQHGDVLERLMARMLAADDVSTATWLLTEVQRQPAFDRGVCERLATMARQRCDEDWLRDQLERGTTDQLLRLSAMVMQLGDDTAERFAAAAAAMAHPLSQWLGDLFGHPNA